MPPPPPIDPPFNYGGFFILLFYGDGYILWRRTYLYIKEMGKKELTICSNPECGVEFLKDKSEINRNKKIGRQNYCSLKCSGTNNHNHLKSYVKENVKFVLPHANNRRDKFTGLREHFRRVKKRKHEYNIDLNDLLDQWEIQKGTCVYSGVKLVHPNDGGDYINTASLDRVDSKLGYVRGNIQFISVACNHAKNSMTHNQMLNFLKIISDFHK